MTKTLIAFRLSLVLVGFAAIAPAIAATHSGSVAGGGNAQSPLVLLDGASKAVRKESYRGVLVYLRGDQLDTLRVLHRFHDDQEEEKLVSLTGPPREVIRTGDKVTSILPAHKVVLISQHPPKSLLGSMTEFSSSRLQHSYSIIDEGNQRFAGRMCRSIRIAPRDKYRYGYRMLIDTQTKLPLKLDLVDANNVLEQLMFTEISFPKTISSKEFLPKYDVQGFQIIKHEAIHVKDSKAVPEDTWVPGKLPPGFTLAEDGVRQVSKTGFVRQMLFTDGVATVSAFVAPAGLRKPLVGATRMGAVNAFGDVRDNMQITVVGEVPAATARMIAEGIRKQAAGDSSAQAAAH